jgi:hypothetical protein
MPRATRQRREPTDDWQQLRLLARFPEQPLARITGWRKSLARTQVPTRTEAVASAAARSAAMGASWRSRWSSIEKVA